MRVCIRWLSYPVIILSTVSLHVWIASNPTMFWPYGIAVSGVGIVLVSILERFYPYHEVWNEDHQDFIPDIFHALFSLGLIVFSSQIIAYARSFLPEFKFWISEEAIWLQMLLAGVIIDFGLWLMHWLSHKNHWLWKFHALHHSSERLYWLNGEKRHPLSALLLALPGVAVCTLIGVPEEVVGAWFAIVSVHLAFQHANLDYQVGPLSRVLGVADVHRQHHYKHDVVEQFNYGEVWMVWDQIFGTYRHPQGRIQPNDIGIDEEMPNRYVDQIMWPFKH